MTVACGAELVAKIRSIAEAEGLTTKDRPGGLSAEREIPLGKWFLGGRKAVYRMSCDLDDGSRGVRFRESTLERSWGVPPPSFRTEVSSHAGTRVHDATTVKSTAGGGQFDLGRVRDAIEAAVGAAGWKFHVEAGRRP